MLKEAIGTGNTIDEAKENAIMLLGAKPEDIVNIEVLQNAKKKSFGLFGGSLAKVKASMEVEDVVEEIKAEEKPAKKAKKEAKKEEPKEEIEVKGVPFEELKEGTPEKKAAGYLITILENLGCENLKVIVNANNNGCEITVSGDGLGVMIGHRGETLDALQHLTSLSANVGEGGYYRVILNTGDYRQRREETLINLAKRMSAQALKAGKCRTLEPMNPYERRIIHTAVQAIDGVQSVSFGEGAGRRVVIAPEGVTPKPRNERRNDRGGRNGRNGRGGRGGKSAYVATPSANKEKVVDAPNIPLYGKIEL